MFDSRLRSTKAHGSKLTKYLCEWLKSQLETELKQASAESERERTECAIRPKFLSLNKELATAATTAMDSREHPSGALVHRGSVTGPELGDDDMTSGSTATVMYLHGMELYISNVGDAQCLLIQSEGGHRIITRKHDPAEER